MCNSCGGQGRKHERKETVINIPAGVDSGEQLQVRGQGHAGVNGGGHGDLYIQLSVSAPAASEAMFKRQGHDLNVEIPIPFHNAILGSHVQVPTLEGTYRMRVAPGTQYGDRRTLGNRGVQKLSQPEGIRGNLNVIFKVTVPKASELTEQQRELLEKYRELVEASSTSKAQDTGDDGKGFFKKTIDKLKETLCDNENNTDDKKQAKK
jgi:molecular chaperone DnaJ